MDFHKFIENWKNTELADQVMDFVYHKDLTDEQKIISLKMILNEYRERSDD